MQLLPADSLTIPSNRQRRVFDPTLLSDLAQSIKTNQLLNPITTRRSIEGVVLVAGERRVRAIQEYIWQAGDSFSFAGQPVPEGMLPCVDMGELDPLQAEEAELEENIRRTDLGWQERAAAVARLNRLRNAQAEARGEPPVPVARIAEEVRGSSLGDAHTATRNDIILADYLNDPDIRAAPSAKEAFKLLKRKEQTARNAALAEQVGKTLSSASHTVLNEDSLEWMEETGLSESFDVIITDPPYGIDADSFGDSAGQAAGPHFYRDDWQEVAGLLKVLALQSYRLAKPQAHLYLFCDIDRFHSIANWCDEAGWWVHRTPLVWHKPNGSRIPWPEHGPQRKYELILYAVKGKRTVARVGSPDLITIPADENLGHQAQKPVALYEELLRRSVKPGDTVLDPFAGSGPVVPSCHGLKCLATGIEKDPAAYGIMVKRLQDLERTGERERRQESRA